MHADQTIPYGLQDRLSPLRRIQELSLGMLEAAQAADWERVISLEGERSPLVQTLFSTPLPEEIHQALAETLSAIFTINQAIHTVAEKARNAVANDLRQFRRKKRANAAYCNTG